MRSLLVTAAVAGAALALGGCHNKPEPVPGPQSAHALLSYNPSPFGPVAQRLVQGTHQYGAFAWKRAKWTG
jgi:hypothetical protein